MQVPKNSVHWSSTVLQFTDTHGFHHMCLTPIYGFHPQSDQILDVREPHKQNPKDLNLEVGTPFHIPCMANPLGKVFAELLTYLKAIKRGCTILHKPLQT